MGNPHDAFRGSAENRAPDLRHQSCAQCLSAEFNHADGFEQQYSYGYLISALHFHFFPQDRCGGPPDWGPPGALRGPSGGQCLRFVVSSISETTSHFRSGSESRSL